METRSSKDQPASQTQVDLSVSAKSSPPHTAPEKRSDEHVSRLRLLFLLIVSIFLAEVASTVVVYQLPKHFGADIRAVVDAGITVILIFPLLYFSSFRPVMRHIGERQKAERLARTERQRFNNILETLPGYLVLLTPDYHVPFANHFFRERFGEARGRRCYEYLFGRDQPCEICDTYKVLKTMQPGRWEWTGPDSRIYDVYDFPFTDTDGATLILEMGIDITEQKHAEAALQTASSYNRSLIEASLDPLVTIGPDGKITDVNAATELVTGLQRSDLIGTDFSEYFTQPDKARAGYQQVFQGGSVHDYPLEICHRDGHTTPVLYNATVYRDESNNVVGVFAAARDITEQKRAEEAIRQLSRIVEQTEDTVVVTNREGVIEYVNPAFERLTGYTKEESLGKTPRVIKSDLHDKEFYQNLWNTILAGEVFQSEMVNRKKNGEIYYEVKTITPLRDTRGDLTHFVATGKDITEHKLDEKKLQKAYDELELRVQERTEELSTANSELEEEILERKRAEETLRKANLRLQDQAEELDAQAEELRLQTEELRDANEQLSKSEATLQGILNATQESIWLFSPDGIILMGNTIALSRMKLPAEKIIGTPFSELMPVNIAQRRQTYLTKAVDTGQPLEFEDQRAGIVFHHNFYPVKDANGRVTGVVAFSRDITERKRAEEQIERSNQKLNEILTSIRDDFYVLDHDWIFVYANRQFTSRIGKEPEDFIGNNIWKMFPKHVGTVFEENLRAAMEKREIRRFEIGGKYTSAWYGMTAFPSPEGITVLGTDITERKLAEEKLSQFNRTLKALNHSNQVMLRSRSETELLNEVCKIIVEDCGHAMVWIGFKEEDEERSVRPVASAGFEEGYIESMKITWADTERGRGPTGTAVRTGESRRCHNMLTDPQFAPWREQALKRGYASSIALPLKAQGNILGAVTIYSRQPDSFAEDEEQLLTELAGDLAYGIMTLRLRAAHAQAEEALRISEERYRTLFNSMTEGFALHEIICDEAGKPCDYRFLEINPSFERLTRLKREAVIGRTVCEVMPGTESYWIETYGQVALTGQPVHFDNYSAGLDRHYEVYAYSPAPRQFAVLFVDITERKHAEDALRESENKFSTLFGKASMPAVLSRFPDHAFVDVNDAWAEAFGYTKEELIGKTSLELGISRNMERRTSLISTIHQHTPVRNVEQTLFTKSGDARIFLTNVNTITIGGQEYALASFQDITERKRAEEALQNLNAELELRVQERTKKLNTLNKKLLNEIKERQEIERQLRIRTTAMEAAANGIIITDPQGNIQWANPALTQISGYEAQDLIGHSMHVFTSGQPDIDYYRQMWDTILSGQVWRGEITNRRKNGSLYVEEQTVTPVRDENDQIQHFIAVKQDITERKKAEAELAQRNVELQIISAAEHKQRQLSEALVEAALILNKSLKLDEVLVLILRQIKEVIPYSLANIALLEGESFYDACHQGDLEWSISGNQFLLESFPLINKTRQSGKPILIPDTEQEPDWVTAEDVETIRSFLSAPLLIEEKAIGFVNLFSDQPGFFTEEMSNRLVAFAAHAAVAIQNAWLFEQVRAGSERLQSLSRRLVEIQENERLYIARELHDEAGQMLTSLMLALVTLESQADQPEAVLKKVAEMEEMLSAVSENLHNVAMALRPASLDHLGLVPALRQYVESVGERYKLKASFISGNFQERLPANMETELYRIVQEALTNVARHARASQVDVVLTTRDHKLIVMVEDDGRGFDPERVPDTGHLGIFGMRERAEMIGGQLVIESKPGKGTTIMVEVDYGSPTVDRG